jgi:hypothetical protein
MSTFEISNLGHDIGINLIEGKKKKRRKILHKKMLRDDFGK